jgi:hypothetical protein
VVSALTLDVVFNGLTPLELPGGRVAWAFGLQGRMLESRETVPSPYNNDSIPCSWPGQQPAGPGTPQYTGCNVDRPGPLVYTATNFPDHRDQQQRAAFGEVQLPIFGSFNISAAVRREEFSGGLGSTVYKVSGKWDVWGPISLRGSYAVWSANDSYTPCNHPLAASEWKVNAFATYSFDKHTFRVGADCASAVYDDRVGIEYGENGEDPIYFDFVWPWDFSDALRLTASIDSISDRDPQKHQMEPGYDRARAAAWAGRSKSGPRRLSDLTISPDLTVRESAERACVRCRMLDP